MTTLIEELQAGPGSRELSDRVLLACGWMATTKDDLMDPSGWVHYYPNVPDPTRNLQDAVDLVPVPELLWRIGHVGDQNEGVFEAVMMSCRAAPVYGHAKAPALALCIALIKARSL